MGGWLALLVARARPERLSALIGIAAAPDFTDWGFTQEQKLQILREGRIEEPSEYGDAPKVTTKAFWHSGEANRRSEEHTSELQSLMRISYAVFCLKKKKNTH